MGKPEAEPEVQSKEVVIEKPIIFWSMGEIELEYFIKELLSAPKEWKRKTPRTELIIQIDADKKGVQKTIYDWLKMRELEES